MHLPDFIDIHEALDIGNIWHGHHHDVHGGQVDEDHEEGVLRSCYLCKGYDVCIFLTP